MRLAQNAEELVKTMIPWTGNENITLDSECYVCNGLGRIKKKNSEDDD